MFPGARDLQLCYNEARVCATVRRAKQRVYIYVAKTTIPVAKDVYIRPTSISFLRICQSPATDVVVFACFRGVFFVSSLIAACSLGLCSLRNSSSMLRTVFVQMAGNSAVDVPRCDTSWYELYV